MKISSTSLFAAALCLGAVAAIAIGLELIDSPQQARMHKLDDKREQALRQISMSVRAYQRTHEKLPSTLETLNLPPVQRQDPVTGEAYEYRVRDAHSYDLCAGFDTTPLQERQNVIANYGECSVPWWKRGQGRNCFTLSVKDCG